MAYLNGLTQEEGRRRHVNTICLPLAAIVSAEEYRAQRRAFASNRGLLNDRAHRAKMKEQLEQYEESRASDVRMRYEGEAARALACCIEAMRGSGTEVGIKVTVVGAASR